MLEMDKMLQIYAFLRIKVRILLYLQREYA